MKRQTEISIFVILIIALLVIIGYFAIDSYQLNKEKEDLEIYNQGMTDGALAISQRIFAEAVQCKTMPLTYGNITVTLIATECLKVKE